MVTKLTEIVNTFMQKEYLINPGEASAEILISAGLKRNVYPDDRLNRYIGVQRRVGGRGVDTLVAKVFALAYPYDYILKSGYEKDWSGWLGSTEYKLGKELRRIEADPKIRNHLFQKSLEHLFASRKKGYITKENASLIGGDYFELGNYEIAKGYFKESENFGNNTKENASLIGECCIRLGGFGEGIGWYEETIRRAKEERFDPRWTNIFDHILEKSFDLSITAQESTQTPVDNSLLQRFRSLYERFTEYWKANEPNKLPILSNRLGLMVP